MRRIPIYLIPILLPIAVVGAQDSQVVDRPASEPPAVQQVAVNQDDALRSPLHELEWMVGRWVDKGEVATITSNCSWKHNGQFLSRSFKITTIGEATLEGTQVIGWDPAKSEIRSWTFDSEGGFGSGRWIRDGKRWLVKMSFVLATGERASAINIITYVDRDTLLWESTNREVAGELQPSIREVTVVRQKSEETNSRQGIKEVSP